MLMAVNTDVRESGKTLQISLNGFTEMTELLIHIKNHTLYPHFGSTHIGLQEFI